MANPGATQPDLVSDLGRLQKRLDDLERKPAPTSLYDPYPSVEWGAIGRPRVSGNVWASCGVSNVTGGKFDRIEAKFLTDWVFNGRSEAEIRIAAFKHSHTTQNKTCVAASSTIRLTGNWNATATTGPVVGLGKWRWIHGLPRGWNVDDDDTDSIYTIELQHRNPDDCLQTADATNDVQVWGFWKREKDNATGWTPSYVVSAEDNANRAAGLKFTDPAPSVGWVSAPDRGFVWDGAYSVSNMHYCVGMPAEQLPEASESGWFWYAGGDMEFVRQPNINEDYFTF